MNTAWGRVLVAIDRADHPLALREIRDAIGYGDKPDKQVRELVQLLTGRGIVERMEDPETETVRYRLKEASD